MAKARRAKKPTKQDAYAPLVAKGNRGKRGARSSARRVHATELKSDRPVTEVLNRAKDELRQLFAEKQDMSRKARQTKKKNASR